MRFLVLFVRIVELSSTGPSSETLLQRLITIQQYAVLQIIRSIIAGIVYYNLVVVAYLEYKMHPFPLIYFMIIGFIAIMLSSCIGYYASTMYCKNLYLAPRRRLQIHCSKVGQDVVQFIFTFSLC